MSVEKRYQDDGEIEIDLGELLFELKKKMWMILLALGIGTGIAGAYSKYIIIPQYHSEAKLYVLSKETTLTSLADLQIGSQLTLDYKELVVSRTVLQEVVNRLKLDMSYRQLASKLSIDNPKNTRILTLTVTDPDPYLAKEIVDEVSNTASEYIGDIMEMIPPKLVESGEVTSTPVSPNVKKNAMMGGLFAAFLVCGVITLQVLLNDTVKTEEDVEKYLNLPVLAEIPQKKSEKSAGKKVVRGKKW